MIIFRDRFYKTLLLINMSFIISMNIIIKYIVLRSSKVEALETL